MDSVKQRRAKDIANTLQRGSLINNISKHDLRMNTTSTAFINLNVNFTIY